MRSCELRKGEMMLSERDWNSSVDHDGYYGCTLRDKGFVPPSLATLDYARLTFVMRMGAKCADGKLEFDGSVVQNHVHTHFSKLDSGEPSCADTHAHARTHRVDMHMLIHTEAHAHARTNRVHMHVLMRTRRSTHFSRLGSGKPSCVSPSGEKMCAQTSQNSTALPVLEPIGARPCART